MPRRPPAAVRRSLRRHHRRLPLPRPSVPGLSGSAMAALRRVDRHFGWPDSWAAEAVLLWIRPLRAIRRNGTTPWSDERYDWHEDWQHPRTVIELALGRLPRRTRRDLLRLTSRADRAWQSRTLPDPFSRTDLPWWLRGIEGPS